MKRDARRLDNCERFFCYSARIYFNGKKSPKAKVCDRGEGRAFYRILGAFLIFVKDPTLAVFFVIMFLVLQQIEGNLIYPRVVGTSIGLPGMWVLLAVSLGGDCDTLTAIAGSIAEAFYGVSNNMQNECFKRLPNELKAIMRMFVVECQTVYENKL